MPTKIEWCDETWNPVIGCSKVSPGCDNCYAERVAIKFARNKISTYPRVISEKTWNSEYAMQPKQIDKPLKIKIPKRIFVCSMGDLFARSIPEDYYTCVFDVIQDCPQHTFLLLTKRPVPMSFVLDKFLPPENRRNIWAGVTCENQEWLEKRLHSLWATTARFKFASIEPMLGPVDIRKHTKFLDWIICGAETGPRVRPMDPEWARDLYNQCTKANIPFFMKQYSDGRDVPDFMRQLPEVDAK